MPQNCEVAARSSPLAAGRTMKLCGVGDGSINDSTAWSRSFGFAPAGQPRLSMQVIIADAMRHVSGRNSVP